MKLGFVSAILPDLDLDQVLAFARESGFETVEPMCWPVGRAERRYAGVTHIDASRFGRPEADDRPRAVREARRIALRASATTRTRSPADQAEAEAASST